MGIEREVLSTFSGLGSSVSTFLHVFKLTQPRYFQFIIAPAGTLMSPSVIFSGGSGNKVFVAAPDDPDAVLFG